MENASKALQMAAWVLIFVLALSISIMMFERANTALSVIIDNYNNRKTYSYIEPSINSKREVGIETIIPSMYRAYRENFRIVFEGITLYKENNNDINYIDLEKETFGSIKKASEHLDKILSNNNGQLYNELKKHRFTEEIGEYYIDDKSVKDNGESIDSDAIEANKTKKRIIKYTVIE